MKDSCTLQNVRNLDRNFLEMNVHYNLHCLDDGRANIHHTVFLEVSEEVSFFY